MKTLRFPLFAALFVLSACGVQQADLDSSNTDVSTDDLGDNADALSRPGRFETYVGQDGQHYFHLIAGNGEKVLASEGYTTTSGALSGIATVQANGADTNRYLIREASDGSWYFVLVAGNGHIIGVSEMYVSQANATRAVGTVSTIVKSATSPTSAPTGARFESFKGLDSKWYFHVRAANGEIVLQSQGYTSSTGANNGIASVQTNGANATRYEVRAAADGKSYFVLKAGNGWIIGRGQMYDDASGAQRGVQTCAALLSGTVQR